MLILTRRIGENVRIGEDVSVSAGFPLCDRGSAAFGLSTGEHIARRHAAPSPAANVPPTLPAGTRVLAPYGSSRWYSMSCRSPESSASRTGFSF